MTQIPQETWVVRCDREGRIFHVDRSLEEWFNDPSGKLAGRKRLFHFFPGEVSLTSFQTWMSRAMLGSPFVVQTAICNATGTRAAASLKFQSNDDQIEVQVQLLPEVQVDGLLPNKSLSLALSKAVAITRAPFLSATLAPVFIGAAFAAYRGFENGFPWGTFLLVVIAASLMQIAANTLNDYFDWTSGTDSENIEYFTGLSGGSRTIEMGIISADGMYGVGISSLLLATLIGGILIERSGWPILLLGLIGAATVYFYSAPSVHLVARKGLGELLVGLNFGPLMTAGTIYSLTGSLSFADFLIGLPIGLLTTGILWTSEFPDAPSDERTGKLNLVVVLGREKACHGYLLLIGGAYLTTALSLWLGVFPAGAGLVFLSLPLAVYSVSTLYKNHSGRDAVKAHVAGIQLDALAGLLFTLGILLSTWL